MPRRAPARGTNGRGPAADRFWATSCGRASKAGGRGATRRVRRRDAFARDPKVILGTQAYRQIFDGGIYIPSIRLNQPLQAECDHFLDCIEQGQRPRTDGYSGLRVVLALEAATASMRNGSVVTPIEIPEGAALTDGG